MRKGDTLTWSLLHFSAIALAFSSLLSGLRIATVSHPEILFFSALLPQGHLHELHFFSAFGWMLLVFGYVLYQIVFFKKEKASIRAKIAFHRIVIYMGYSLILLLLLSGLSLYLNLLVFDYLPIIHYYAALAFLMYVVVHIFAHFIEYGIAIFPGIFRTSVNIKKESTIISLYVSILLLLAIMLYLYKFYYSYHLLNVVPIKPNIIIKIDGIADEEVWQNALMLTIHTFGGANFAQGESRVEIKALQNQEHLFFHFRWKDATKSVQHLPLKKVQEGWKVMENGFYDFNETQYYEDKLALIISQSSQVGAARTIHLGPNPLADKPPNWHGRGYHYSEDKTLHDLWQWKAIRTNGMYQADDSHITSPDIERHGLRRYSAGYMPDSKESGAYIMNWQWYTPEGITPLRLPKNNKDIKSIDNEAIWNNYTPYQATNDNYAIGTILPSVLYESNQFEGDRGDVTAYGVWHDGYWSLEAMRSIETHSSYDVALNSGVYLWVALFDHVQILHTRHALPIRLHYQNKND